ncbi:restriction endonuclease subunit S [Faecalibacillus intestinalis]|uniref:restriction endonuclease subunit S n=2 Tax=Faecalibacillus intestinalis TaxID=1982626 RepID=UPI0039A074C5
MDKKNKNPNVPNLRFPLYKNKWECKKIKDILKICHGKDYKHLESGKYPVLGTSGIFTYVNQYLCDWPCALIGRKGASLDKPHYMNSPFWCVDTLYYSKPVKNNNPKWQYYFFQTINWMKMNESSGIPSLRASTIENIDVFVPSYQEQSNIVEFLDKIEQRIETQIKIISSIESQIKSINNHVAFDSATNELSIGNLFDIKTNSKILEKHDGKYCIVDMGTIDSNGNYITGKYTDDITSILTKGTLVMPKDDIGGGKIICKTLYINESNKYVLSDHVFALKLRNSKYNPLYFSSLINSQYHNHNLKRLVTGSAQLGINQENLNKYKLRFSDCLELQKKYSKLIQLINEKLFIEKNCSMIYIIKKII